MSRSIPPRRQPSSPSVPLFNEARQAFHELSEGRGRFLTNLVLVAVSPRRQITELVRSVRGMPHTERFKIMFKVNQYRMNYPLVGLEVTRFV